MIIVDIETTGIDPNKHSIVSIGAIDLEDPSKQFYVENQMWEGSEVYEGDDLFGYKPAFSINGFTLVQVTDKNKLSLKQAIGNFISWSKECDEKLIAGYNTYFDLGFLKKSADMSNLDWSFGGSSVDLKSLIYVHMVQRGLIYENLKSADCFRYVGLPPEETPHNALWEAKLKAEALSRIIYGKKLLDEFSKYPIPEYLTKK